MSAGLSIVEVNIERGIHRAFYDDIRQEIEDGTQDAALAQEVRAAVSHYEAQMRACRLELESIREARELRLAVSRMPAGRPGSCRDRGVTHRVCRRRVGAST